MKLQEQISGTSLSSVELQRAIPAGEQEGPVASDIGHRGHAVRAGISISVSRCPGHGGAGGGGPDCSLCLKHLSCCFFTCTVHLVLKDTAHGGASL